jgi:membrane protein
MNKWWAILKDSGNGIVEHDGATQAASLAFSLFLAIFPFLIVALVSAAAFGGQAFANDVQDDIFRILPGYVAETITPEIERVIEARGSGGLFTFGILVLIFSVSGAVETIRFALNAAYGCPETRSLWYRRLTGLATVIVVILSLLLVAALGLALPLIWDFITPYLPTLSIYETLFNIARTSILFVVMAGLLAVLHIYLPARKLSFRRVLPGIILTLILWWLAAKGFAWYLEAFGDFAATYAGLAGIIAALFFFQIAGIVLVFGAELNRAITEGNPEKSDKNACYAGVDPDSRRMAKPQ